MSVVEAKTLLASSKIKIYKKKWRAINLWLNWTVGEGKGGPVIKTKRDPGGLNCRLLAISQNTEQPLFTEGLLVLLFASVSLSSPYRLTTISLNS